MDIGATEADRAGWNEGVSEGGIGFVKKSYAKGLANWGRVAVCKILRTNLLGNLKKMTNFVPNWYH